MKAVLLCGGIGKRMFPLTEDKLLLKFLGKTLLQHQIEKLRETGLNEIVLVANPRNKDNIEQIIKGISGIKVSWAIQNKPLGIADALQSAEGCLDGEVLVVNSNDVIDISAYHLLLEESRKATDSSYLVGYEVKEYFPGGYMVMNEDNALERIVEKPPRGEEPSNVVNIMLHLHSDIKKVLEFTRVVETTKDDVYECALDRMVSQGVKIKVVPYGGFWAAIKYPWHIFGVVRYFLEGSTSHISSTAQISPRATVEGKVVIGDRVRVLENAVVRGPVFIGAGSVIGNNALVRDHSHIGENCVVGYSTEVKGSYVGDRCWFHSSYVGDSIVSDDCSFGAGTVLANFRFDEGNIRVKAGNDTVDTGLDKFGTIMGVGCKTGINASIMPGVKIGPNSFVGSHVCLMNNLEPNKMVVMEPRYRVMDNRIGLDAKKKAELMQRLERL
jgi:UDP-N-acetylglucosamine diphosphorylase / glucose-1-phosphate thymidylyltransferase / UDP-N-acetylgalactosamine diphosphorylase / glucosamine-1-phosphate N-acetyltransferase / galactosamine-1-phosphate N-acetyltransferase